ncbi:hypothetical protein [Streptomyces sp. NPDC088246]|uniref:hypothetical protein n=1 Tax=Streptomyces sp. NPDC088246 TaxID=3365842 RepID=UPI00380E8750
MSEQAQFVAVAAAAAAALVAEMTKDGWAAARDVVARAFRRGGEQLEEQQLARLDADQREAQTTERSVLLDRWQRRLLTLVEDYPEALQDLAPLVPKESETQARVNLSAIGNSGPVIQAGRDNFGGLHTGGQ